MLTKILRTLIIAAHVDRAFIKRQDMCEVYQLSYYTQSVKHPTVVSLITGRTLQRRKLRQKDDSTCFCSHCPGWEPTTGLFDSGACALSTTLPAIRELGHRDKARCAWLCGRGAVISSPGDTVFPLVKGP